MRYGIQYSRKTGIGNVIDISYCLSSSDWRGLNRNQKQTAILEYGDELEMNTYKEPLNYINTELASYTYAELFAGIGGVSFGFESIGAKGVMAAEYDPLAEGKRQFAQDAYKLLHPNVTNIQGDVFKLDANDVPNHDVLSFTTPCQSFSVAGKRLGFEDTRGTLVFEALRIAKQKQPKVLFMENVKGLVNHDKGNTLDTILHAMNEVGYVVDFNVLNSKYFGVPQNRERVFIVGVRKDLVNHEEWKEERLKGNTMLPKRYKSLIEQGLETFNFDWPTNNEITVRLKDVLEKEVDDKYYLAEDKVKDLIADLHNEKDQLAIKEGVAIPTLTPFREEKRQNGPRFKLKEEVAHTVNTQDRHGVTTIDENTVVIGHVNLKGHDLLKRVYDTNGQSPTINSMGGGNREPKIVENEVKNNTYKIRKLTPRECMRLQGFPDSATDKLYELGFSNSRVYKFAGNAVTTTVIQALGLKIQELLHNL